MYAEDRSKDPELVCEASAPLPTRWGPFQAVVFRHRSEPDKEHVALVRGDLPREGVLCRVHSECLTGEVLGSLKCDCGGQLEQALKRIAEHGSGVLVYLRQEGRGIGLAQKLRAYALQADAGLDTVDANTALGLPADARRYDAAAAVLRWLGVHSVQLMTNNPAKAEALAALGIRVKRSLSVVTPTNPHSARYLATKRLRMRHTLPLTAVVHIEEQST